MITIDIPQDVEAFLLKEAKREGISLAEVAKTALLAYFEEREDYSRGIAVLQRVKSGKEKTISLDALTYDLEH